MNLHLRALILTIYLTLNSAAVSEEKVEWGEKSSLITFPITSFTFNGHLSNSTNDSALFTTVVGSNNTGKRNLQSIPFSIMESSNEIKPYTSKTLVEDIPNSVGILFDSYSTQDGELHAIAYSTHSLSPVYIRLAKKDASGELNWGEPSQVLPESFNDEN